MSIYVESMQSGAGSNTFGRVREFLHSSLFAIRLQPDEVELPLAPRNRQEALIHAARTALGGTVEW